MSKAPTKKPALTPAEDDPWGKFLLKTIELDTEHDKRSGAHWLWLFYRLRKKIPQAMDKDQNGDNIEKHIGIMGFNEPSTGDYFESTTQDLVAEIGNPKTIEQINLSNLMFQNDIDFSEFRFPTDASFANTTFCGEVKFRLVNFKTANFSNAKFLKKADFDVARFSGESLFKNVTFSNPVTFLSATFKKNINFSKVVFPADARFDNARFSSKANFKETKFYEMSNFSKASFEHGVNFSEAIFSKDTNFSDTKFMHDGDFSNTIFFKEALFTNAIFLETANFKNATFHGDTAKFRDAVFKKVAIFKETTFKQYANFTNSKFNGRTIFQQATFELHSPRFYEAELCKEITWDDINWPKFPNVIWALLQDFLRIIDYLTKDKFKFANTKHINIIRENQNAYEDLANHMEKLNKYHDQHLFFRQEMGCRRRLENYFTRFFYWFYETTSNYGYGVGRAFLCWAAHILLWAGALSFNVFQDKPTPSDNLTCSLLTSLTNAHSFLLSKGTGMSGCYNPEKTTLAFNVIWAGEAILGAMFLFLLLTTLRVRFRLK